MRVQHWNVGIRFVSVATGFLQTFEPKRGTPPCHNPQVHCTARICTPKHNFPWDSQSNPTTACHEVRLTSVGLSQEDRRRQLPLQAAFIPPISLPEKLPQALLDVPSPNLTSIPLVQMV